MKILITGASRGIGLAEAKALGEENELFLVATSIASFKDESIKKHHLFGYDLRKISEIKKFVDELKTKTDSLDVLINNVGMIVLKKFKDMSLDEINDQVDLNLKSHMILTKMLLPLLEKSNKAHIIFMSSMAAKSGIIGESVYAATKAGISKFADILRKEMRGKAKVSIIHSWGVNTFGSASTDLLKPEDIADIVKYIISKDFVVESIDVGHINQWRGGNAPWSP